MAALIYSWSDLSLSVSVQNVNYWHHPFAVHSNLKTILYTLNTERERLKSALEAEGGGGGNNGIIATLRNTLHQTMQQNTDLRSRLSRIHESSDLSDLSETVSLVSTSSQNIISYIHFWHIYKNKSPTLHNLSSCNNSLAPTSLLSFYLRRLPRPIPGTGLQPIQ